VSRRARDESGQVLPLLALGLMVALLGMTGLVVDVASWYRAQRHAQAVADAVALAAAQDLPGATTAATTTATSYATLNGGAIAPPLFSPAHDAITVEAHEQASAFFTRVFGLDHVTVHAKSTVTVYSLASIGNVVPIAINAHEPALNCTGKPCFGQETSLVLGKIDGVGGGFGLLDYSNSNGNVSPSTLADWIMHGFPGELPIGQYQSPGNRYNSAAVRNALASLASSHPTVLVPVYTAVSGSGTSGIFTIAGFGAFHVDSYDGSSHVMTGSFQHVIAHGQHARGQGAKYYGVSQIGITG
jgi:hypothetical protein